MSNRIGAFRPVAAQRGVVLMLALIMLIAMTMAGIALYRQIGVGIVVARNLTFKRGATVASDFGIETARTWLVSQNTTTLEQPGFTNGNFNGYFPAWCNSAIVGTVPDANNDGAADDCRSTTNPLLSQHFDPTTYNWANAQVATTNDGSGNDVRYVIHRLCSIPGGINVSNQFCVVLGSSTAGNESMAPDYNYMQLSNTMQPYYRITTRVLGPTNTVVFTQTIIY